MKTKRLAGWIVTLMVAGAVAAAAAETEPLGNQVADAIRMFDTSGHGMRHLFKTAYGYAVFPSVGKGAVGIGAAEGHGQVYENGALVGTAKLTQVTLGAQLGGESYSEVIFFQTPEALEQFKEGKTALSAGLNAVAAASAASAEAKYQQGVLVRTMAKSGLMFEASIGGQHFQFTPLSTKNPAATEATPTGTAAPSSTPATGSSSETPAQQSSRPTQ